jgi:hypothetical protein
VNAFHFYDGVPKILVPDNLKSGVEKASSHSPTINKVYNEMAEHYGMAVIPARLRKPKDKPSVEGAVRVISTWIIAALRNETFFSLAEINKAIKEKLQHFNQRQFQKNPESRWSAFLDQEKHTLQHLQTHAYELAAWKIATVQLNCHISVNGMHYSVPYEYIKQKVDVRITRSVIEVFYKNYRICSHPRLNCSVGKYQTMETNMPEQHKQFVQWNAERFVGWAEGVGPYTTTVIRAMLSYHRIEQQGHKACMAVLKLADRYSLIRLESASAKALSYTPQPSYKNDSTILKTGQNKIVDVVETNPARGTNAHGITRGATYYGGRNHVKRDND